MHNNQLCKWTMTYIWIQREANSNKFKSLRTVLEIKGHTWSGWKFLNVSGLVVCAQLDAFRISLKHSKYIVCTIFQWESYLCQDTQVSLFSRAGRTIKQKAVLETFSRPASWKLCLCKKLRKTNRIGSQTKWEGESLSHPFGQRGNFSHCLYWGLLK